MWINRTKYEVEKLKYRQRISYLENLICPCESHDYVDISHEYIFEYSHGFITEQLEDIRVLKCKKCGKLDYELS